MVRLYAKWLDSYPIVSSKTAWPEDDWDGWASLTEALETASAGGRRSVCHQRGPAGPGRGEGRGNAILIKLNQIGTLTETMQCIELARPAATAR